MKRLALIVTVMGILLAAAVASAATYTFSPTPRNLWDFDHSYYQSWGMAWSIPAGEKITEATLFIDNINNWQLETNNVLYIHLLDNPALGAKQFLETQTSGDAWRNKGSLVATYTDRSTAPESLAYSLRSLGLIDKLTGYAADGRFGFGFDPDCHYYNDGVRFEVTTSGSVPPVPTVVAEPGSLAAFAVAANSLLASIAKRRRRRSLSPGSRI